MNFLQQSKLGTLLLNKYSKVQDSPQIMRISILKVLSPIAWLYNLLKLKQQYWGNQHNGLLKLNLNDHSKQTLHGVLTLEHSDIVNHFIPILDFLLVLYPHTKRFDPIMHALFKAQRLFSQTYFWLHWFRPH